MIKFEFSGEIGETTPRESKYFGPNVTLTKNNVQDYTVNEMFDLWEQFMSGMGYYMGEYFLAKSDDKDSDDMI